jgi:hypothetical protein
MTCHEVSLEPTDQHQAEERAARLVSAQIEKIIPPEHTQRNGQASGCAGRLWHRSTSNFHPSLLAIAGQGRSSHIANNAERGTASKEQIAQETANQKEAKIEAKLSLPVGASC